MDALNDVTRKLFCELVGVKLPSFLTVTAAGISLNKNIIATGVNCSIIACNSNAVAKPHKVSRKNSEKTPLVILY